MYAAAKIDGRTIRKGSIPANRVKPESLTGAQVSESALGTVPSAARAQEAAHALIVGRAASAARAETAVRADVAVAVPSATLATTAEHAKLADTATRAGDAESLGGIGGERYLRHCDAGSVKAVATVNPAGANPVVVGSSCAAGGQLDATITPVAGRPGEYDLEVRGLVGNGPEADALENSTAMGSGFGINSAVSVNRSGHVFRIKVFSSGDEVLLANEPFTVAIF